METVSLNRRDIGRLLAGVRERKRKFERGLKKFSNDFDPEKGKNMQEGYDAYCELEEKLERHM